jgi:antitoxin component of MazEF toxin-antitoxin module
MSSKFTTTVQQYADTQDLFIEIPHYILQNLNWEEGDELAWSIKANQIILTKVKDASESQEESGEINDWYTVKAAYIEDYLNSESEGKDFDTYYDDYIEATNEETFGPEGYELP